MSVELLYGLVVLALWHAPIYGWLLLISGWARRTTFLWAVLPPLGLVVIERIAFDSTRIGHFLLHRLGGGFALAFAPAPDGSSPSDPMLRLDPAPFLSSPDLWLGLAVAAAFLAACIWLRRNREPL
jgi:ABC-2 type transport system permease protein